MSERPPNILLLLSDNQRLDTLSVLGQTACRTPTWDRVARDGVLMDHMRTTSPVCSPARASMFTGQHPQRTGMLTVGFDYAEHDDGSGGDEAPSLKMAPCSHHLREAGYETVYAGKWHLGEHNVHQWFDRTAVTDQAYRDYTEWCRLHGLPDGFVFHDPVRSKPFRSTIYPHMSLPRTGVLDIPDDKEHNFWILGHAVELLASRRCDRPLFMTLSLEGPHPPLVVPRKYYDMYSPDDVAKPPNWEPGAAEPSFMAGSYYRRQRHELGDDFDVWRKSTAVYWGYATYIDELFGRFLDCCGESGLLDNTLVIMCSDHGEMMGQHGLNQKMCPYEEDLRVPCVMSWPGVIPPGSRCGMDVSLIDVAPTILAAAGLDPASLEPDGENLLEYFAGERSEPDSRDCFTQWSMTPFEATWHGVQNWRCLVRRPWKYILHQNGEAELYNSVDDPYEMVNLAAAEPAGPIEAELRQDLLAWAQRTGDPFAERVKAV